MSALKLKIKKGDTVVVTSGSNKGAKGEVLRVIPSENRAVVQGVNMRTHYNKPSQTSVGSSNGESAKDKAMLFLNDAQNKNKNSQIIPMV